MGGEGLSDPRAKQGIAPKISYFKENKQKNYESQIGVSP